MSTAVGKSRWDERVWSVATRSLAIVFPIVVVALVFVLWLLARVIVPVPEDTVANFHVSVLVACGVTFVIALLVGFALVRRESAPVRGIALSVAASGVVLLIIGVSNVLWVY